MTRDQVMATNYEKLGLFAQELAESWVNGNRTDVLETLSRRSARSSVLALLVAQALTELGVLEPTALARALYRREHA